MAIAPVSSGLAPLSNASVDPTTSPEMGLELRRARGFQGIEDTLPRTAGPSSTGDASFLATFKKAVAEVNDLQVQAEAQARALTLGEVRDLHQVTIATEKASLALGLAIQVRNKILEAYQEIMRMQV